MLIRLLRKRYVLAIIFFASLTYFVVKTGLYHLLLANQDASEKEYLAMQRLSAHRHIQWYKENNTDEQICRNSRQGRELVTDERGFTCRRTQLLDNSCCRSDSDRFSCNTCDKQYGCCRIYEFCVSCCLRPEQKSSLENVIREVSDQRLKLFLAVRDQYELCLLKCRTSSSSVHHENKYVNHKLKYCYGLEPKPSSDTNEN